MPFKCYYKPERTKPRKFTASDAARIICYAKQSGATDAEITKKALDKCGFNPCNDEKERERVTELDTKLQEAETALEVFAEVTAVAIAAAAFVARVPILRRFSKIKQLTVTAKQVNFAQEEAIKALIQVVKKNSEKVR